MKTLTKPLLLAAWIAFLVLALAPVLVNASDAPALSGRVVDMQGLPVQGAHVALFLGDSAACCSQALVQEFHVDLVSSYRRIRGR